MPLRDAINPGITFAPSYAEWEAATAAGLNMWAWDRGDYPSSFKAKVIAWFTAHRLVDLHSQAAVNAAVERKMKRQRR